MAQPQLNLEDKPKPCSTRWTYPSQAVIIAHWSCVGLRNLLGPAVVWFLSLCAPELQEREKSSYRRPAKVIFKFIIATSRTRIHQAVKDFHANTGTVNREYGEGLPAQQSEG